MNTSTNKPQQFRAKLSGTSVRWGSIGVLLLVGVFLPFRLGPSHVFNLSHAMVLACAVVGMVLLTGFTKQISLGQNFFFAGGAYLAAFAINEWGLPYLLAPVLAFVACYFVGYLFGLPVLGIRGTYLTLITIGLGLVTPHLVRRFEGFTGGSMGTQITSIKAPGWMPLDADQWLYFVCLFFLLIVIVTAKWIENSQVGRAMRAAGDNEIAASLSGVNVRLAKSTAFAWSGGFAGVSGALFVLLIGYIAPGSIDLFLAIYLLAALVIGGQYSVIGAVLGSFFIVFVPLQVERVSDSLSGALFGSFIILTMLVFRDGIAGAIAKVWNRFTTTQHSAQPMKEKRA